MEKFDKNRLNNIQRKFEEKTGTNLSKEKSYVNFQTKKIALAGIMALCVFTCYFILNNNHLEPGQERVRSFSEGETVALSGETFGDMDQVEKGKRFHKGTLSYDSWVWPTECKNISCLYGVQSNGLFSDHINIAGELSDPVYAVADGTVVTTDFEQKIGYYIVIDLGDETNVKYGHLKEIYVKEGDIVKVGDTIGSLGASGMATGPNLYFAVFENGESVNPLEE